MSKGKLKQNENPVGADASVRPNSRGITLVALIITIIVMLILVGVSVTVALNGGLFSTAKDAQAKTEEEKNRELALAGGQVEIDGEIYNSIEDYVNKNQLTNAKCKQIGDLLYVGNESTKKAVVYGNRENMDYTNAMWQMYLMVNNLQVTATEINILSELKIDGEIYTVTEVASSAFCGMMNQVGVTSITTVTIPDSVTTIGSNAFKNCTSLSNITIPDSVTNIGTDAFAGTPWLEKNTIDGLLIINNILLDGKGATGDVTIPSNVISIADNAFSNNTSITSVTLPDSVTNIGSSAFYGCTSLTSVTLPDSVTNIGDHAFYGCTGLTSILLPYNLEIIDVRTFEECTSLISVTIPDGVTSIEDSAFRSCTSLTNIEIPDSVTNIGSSAFENCTSLTSVTMPDSVTSIGDNAFEGTPWMENNTTNGLFIINNILQDGKGATGDVTIPSGVVSIADGAFSSNISITSVEIPKSVTSIGSSAFGSCTSLTSIEIPDSVTSIGSSAFLGCTSITSVTIPDSIINIGSNVFNNTPWFEEQKANATNGLVIINNILIDASDTTGDVIIPDTVTVIGQINAMNITSVLIPNSVISISEMAFCVAKLTTITIPESVVNMGANVFVMSSSLKEIKVSWEEGNKPDGWNDTWYNTGFTTPTIVYGYTVEN